MLSQRAQWEQFMAVNTTVTVFYKLNIHYFSNLMLKNIWIL